MNTIICAAFDNWELTKITLDSLLANTKMQSRIIIINNGSTDGTQKWIDSILRRPLLAEENAIVNWANESGNGTHNDIIFVNHSKNEGCGIGRNVGSRLIKEDSDYITFVDNDIVATDGWDTEMIRFMDSHPEVGICGPMTNFAGTPQLLNKIKFKLPQTIEEVHTFANFFKSTYKNKWSYVLDGFVIIGFCMMIRKECFNQLRNQDGSLFDERFKLYGNEDNDLCRRATSAGWRLAYYGGCYVHHWGSKSLQALADSGVDWGKQWNENRKAFDEKWKQL